MVVHDFPCKTCGHAAIKHYVNISEDYGICTLCVTDTRNVQDGDQFHEFVGDNLKYLELQKKKQELLNE